MNLMRFHFVLALTALVLMTLPLHANPILPGGTVSPDIFPNPGSVPLLAQTSGTYSFGSGIGLITGTYDEEVAVDPFGVTCSGCLDFAYQVSLDPYLSAGIFNVGLGRYFGYSTDVGYIDGSGDNPCCSGDGAPIAVSRGPFGGTLEFVFVTPTAGEPIGPGGQSAILIVATDAKTYDSRGILGISGGRSGSPANGQITGLFEPTFQAPVPEPSTAALLSLGVAGIAVFSRKRRNR
jgi:hypothetical protein